MSRGLQQRLWAGVALPLNSVMAQLAQCYEIAQCICFFMIAIKQLKPNDMMNINYCLLAGLLLFAAYLTLFAVTDQRRPSLFMPRRPTMFILLFGPATVNIGRIILALTPVAHALHRTKTAVTCPCILRLMNGKCFTALDASQRNQVLRSSPSRVRFTFAAFRGATLRAVNTFTLARPTKLLAADGANLHSASLSLRPLLDVVRVAGLATFSRSYSLDHTCILSQNGAVR